MKYKNTLKKTQECDVFVIGAGIAGTISAIQASINGSKVIISSNSNILSGSSFYPGTWGLGMIGPKNKEDEKDLIETIIKVGCNVVDKELVKTLVENINPSFEFLNKLGVKLKRAENENQKEFIPCFDYKKRNWNGLVASSAKEVFTKLLSNKNILQYPYCEVIDIIKENNEVRGVVLINSKENLEFISCKSVIIASGGIGGLFKYRLNTNDIIGSGQALALKAGCKLTNLEFMQMMPGYVSPRYKTIFNEKTFKFIEATNSKNENVFLNIDKLKEKLETRSTYGPFTSRLASKDIDYAIFKEFLKDEKGIKVRYKEEIKNNPPEFIKVYFEWLKENKNLTIDDRINIGIFFHAANGGIYINSKAETGIHGLYAAGECTGGMHGADRIGGLSTVNGLVFGRIAGKNASNYAKKDNIKILNEVDFEVLKIKNSKELIEKIQEIMFNHAMIEKNENGIKEAFKALKNIENSIEYENIMGNKDLKYSYRLLNNLLLAKAIMKSIDLRKESRGSHYRSDFKETKDDMNKRIVIQFNNKINSYFIEE